MRHANRAAKEMLRAGDPILGVGGKLALRHELVPGQLQRAVRTASEDEQHLERRGIGIPARLRDGVPLAVHVMPLQRRALRGELGTPATAAVFVTDAGAPLAMPADAMRLLYELTPAEQRVFELVVAGLATEEIAGTLGVAPSTVRTQLLRVFEKTGRHNRTELVKLSREITLPA
jgi:DNA-binding CsgD family transcriptional regulator